MEDVQAAKEASALLASVEQKVGGTPANWDAFKRSVVIAGQDVTAMITLFGNEIQTGPGLRQEGQHIFATLCGLLHFQPPNVFWVEHRDHRYMTMKEDHVIGVITQQFSEAYTVDISSTSKAVLATLAFDGASKRNHPNLPVGSLVYARVEATSSFMEPVLSCQVVNGTKKDWMTGQAAFGELKGGHVVKCSLDLARQLLDPECVVLDELSKSFAYEIAVGVNGWLWIDAETSRQRVVIANAVLQSEQISPKAVPSMVAQLVMAHIRGGGGSRQNVDSEVVKET